MSDSALTETSPAPVKPNAYRQATMGSWKKARPIQALFELTYRCNHLCTFCNNPLSREGSELSTEEAFRVIGELKELGIRVVNLSLTSATAESYPLARHDARPIRLLRLFVTPASSAWRSSASASSSRPGCPTRRAPKLRAACMTPASSA